MQPIGGMLIDKIGLTAGFACLHWRGAGQHGAWRGAWLAVAGGVPGLLGMAEAAAIPAGMKTIGEWFPDRERSVAVGWFNAGTSLGAVIAPVLAALVAKPMAGRRPLS
jgi:ACS family hexuronate transporter-like MFS transporter